MKKTRHTDEQFAFALKQAETGTAVAEVIRRMGISEADALPLEDGGWRAWRGELRRLRLLEAKNRKLKQLVADLVRTVAGSDSVSGTRFSNPGRKPSLENTEGAFARRADASDKSGAKTVVARISVGRPCWSTAGGGQPAMA